MLQLISRSQIENIIKIDTLGLARVEIKIEKKPYIIKTANSWSEVHKALRLRHRVFIEEMLGEDRGGLDQDEFDLICDHLLIIEQATGEVVGTYRVNSSLFGERFYSEKEFNLGKDLRNLNKKMELGRACIDPAHRNGIVINLLWRGILEYMGRTDSDILFGCATVMSQDPLEVSRLIRYLNELDVIDKKYRVAPINALPGVERFDLSLSLTETERENAKKLLPSLCLAYIRAGAKLSAIPAWDPEFRCVDFFTILEKENLSPLFLRRYGASINI